MSLKMQEMCLSIVTLQITGLLTSLIRIVVNNLKVLYEEKSNVLFIKVQITELLKLACRKDFLRFNPRHIS